MEVSRSRIIAAWFVWGIHMLVLAWMMVGAFLPYMWAWWSILILGLILEIHWTTNGNRCILSDLEVALRGPESGREKGDGVFIRCIVEKITKRKVPDLYLNILAHGVIVVVAVISLAKLILST